MIPPVSLIFKGRVVKLADAVDYGSVLELADKTVSKAVGENREGSSPSAPTIMVDIL